MLILRGARTAIARIGSMAFARREFGSGISANVDAMARVGLLYLRGGLWHGRRLLPSGFVAQAGTTVPRRCRAARGQPERVRQCVRPLRPALVEQRRRHPGRRPARRLLVVGPVRQPDRRDPQPGHRRRPRGQSWKRPTPGHYDVLRPFLGPIAASAGKTTTRLAAPNRGPAADDELPIQQDVNAVPRGAEMPRVVARHHQRVVRGGPQNRIRP